MEYSKSQLREMLIEYLALGDLDSAKIIKTALDSKKTPKRLTVQAWFQAHPPSTYEDKKRPGFMAKDFE